MKYYLKEASFTSKEEFFLEICEILNGILSTILLSAFEDWMEGLVRIIADEYHYHT
jgi:hypothetical protein